MMRASKWIWSAAAVLLCLTLFSFHLTGGLYARYTSDAAESDSARVARFDVKVNGPDDVAVSCTQSADGQYVLNIKNDSEVAVQYRVEVQPQTDELQDTVSVQIDQPTGILAANSPMTTVTLTFSMNEGSFTEEFAQGNSLSVTKKMAYTITVYAEQVD